MKKLLILTFLMWSAFTLHMVKAQAPDLTPEEKYNTELNEWVDRLAWDESHNTQNLIIVDTDGNLAYSCLQFHYGTFVSYSRKYDLKGEVGSCKNQKELAKVMIKDDWKNWRHWYTSVTTKTSGYPPKPI